MHPAFSVIFFTTLSGTGYGLLFWSALAALSGRMPARPLLVATALALVLVTVGLLSSLAHLGKPGRSWRAFSQWRTSWLSREGVAAVLAYVPALLFAALLLPGMISNQAQGEPVALALPGAVVCGVLVVCAAATVYCTAMIYASLRPIPAWQHRLVVPGYFGFALLCGGLLLAAIASLSGVSLGNAPAMAAVALAAGLWWLKARYWRDIDATPLPMTRGDAVGLPGRKVTVFERPHTEANYLVREMGFVVARKHARRLRRLAIALFAIVPIVCMLPVWLFVHFDAGAVFALATVSALAGAFVERWLFFAQARHMVTLYY
ncbi:MAG TPA: DmsC/YnfH family molybdoenzyme membrane anchor subunit [Lysobacter sp.]